MTSADLAVVVTLRFVIVRFSGYGVTTRTILREILARSRYHLRRGGARLVLKRLYQLGFALL